MSDIGIERRVEPTTVAVASATLPSHVDWPAIFAGAVVAAATSFVATAFGSAIGFSLTSPYKGPKPEFFFPALALWLIWITVSSFAAGGYVTGRLRRRVTDCSQHEIDVRDGAHGLVMWALAVVLGAAIGSAGLSSAAKSGAEAVAAKAEAASPQQAYVDALLRGTGELRIASEANDSPRLAEQTPPRRPIDARETARLNDEALRRALAEARENALEMQRGVDEPTRRIVEGIVWRTPDGAFDPQDQKYLENVIVSRTKLSPQEADRRIADVSARMKTDNDKALELAEKARKVGIVVAFLAASTLAVGAATAFGATRLGGRHRDENLDLSHLVRPYRIR